MPCPSQSFAGRLICASDGPDFSMSLFANGDHMLDTRQDSQQRDLQERPRAASPRSNRPAIAILPFLNMSGEPEQDHFSDGISEDIIGALSKVRWFLVIARSSSFAYKGKSVPMRQIAEELGIGYLVEGSVRKIGDRVR